VGLANTQFVALDLAHLDLDDALDSIILFDAIHDQAQPRTMLRNIARALRRGGTFLALDLKGSSHLHVNLDHPLRPWAYGFSTCTARPCRWLLAVKDKGAMWGEQKAGELCAEVRSGGAGRQAGKG